MNKGKGKTLILVRHAHRDTSDRLLDNGLSKKGRRQVQEIEKTLLKTFGTDFFKEARFFSSPKRRCIETLFPLSSLSKTGLKIDPFLDEQTSMESDRDFAKRVERAMESLTQLDADVICCSHGDWIPLGSLALGGGALALKKGAYLIFTCASAGGWQIHDTLLTKS